MLHPPTSQSARITEIFSSLQGEGPLLGQRHIFIRFEECHIHCGYCDELDKNGREWSLESVLGEVERLERESGPHRYISLTGGEPLLYINFLRTLVPALKVRGFSIYLETNGILWEALSRIISVCDFIAMDMKPASVTGEGNFDSDHKRFLDIAVQKPVFIKFVISKQINFDEFDRQVNIVSEFPQPIPVVLQPVSSVIEGHDDPELMEILESLQKSAARKIPDVRIVPRFHKIFNLR